MTDDDYVMMTLREKPDNMQNHVLYNVTRGIRGAPDALSLYLAWDDAYRPLREYPDMLDVLKRLLDADLQVARARDRLAAFGFWKRLIEWPEFQRKQKRLRDLAANRDDVYVQYETYRMMICHKNELLRVTKS